MLKQKYFRVALVVLALAVMVFANGARPQRTETTPKSFSISAPDDSVTEARFRSSRPVSGQIMREQPEAASPDALDSPSTFYTVRADMRKCMSPMCGGYFVKSINLPLTRCANGQAMPECYVAEIDWNGQPEAETVGALLRGSLTAKSYGGRFGNLGMLRVTEAWAAVSIDHPGRSPKYPVVVDDGQPEQSFYLVRDRGIRCIAYPCPTHHEVKLNSTLGQNIAGVNLSDAKLGAEDQALVQKAMTGPDAAIIKGSNVPVRGRAGKSQELKAKQVYLRARKTVATMKPCIKTGCSSQICSDHDVISTCEFRPEYACYQKATCQRQDDGNCGFTKTRELTSCLAAKR